MKLGVKWVYTGTCTPLTHPDPSVTPLMLDLTNVEQIQKTAAKVGSLDILINNAGVAYYGDLSYRTMLDRHLPVKLFGTYGLTEAFLPSLMRSLGVIVNLLSGFVVLYTHCHPKQRRISRNIYFFSLKWGGNILNHNAWVLRGK